MNARQSSGSVNNIKHNWKAKSKLEQKLILSLIIVTILLIALLLYVIVIHAGPTICKTPTCLSATAQILNRMDLSANPCDDFLKFACGKFTAKPTEDFSAQLKQHWMELMQKQKEENAWIRHEKSFFESCMNETVLERETRDVFEATLQDLAGWPVVVGYQWKDEVFDWKEMIYSLRNQGYRFNTILDLHIKEDPNNTDVNIVHVTVPKIRNHSQEHKELYKKYMTNIAVIFGAERNRATIEMEKVLDFMDNIAKVATEYSHTEFSGLQRFTVGEFQEINGEIDWLAFINTILDPVAKLSIHDYVMVPESEFLKGIFKLLYRVNKRTIANYIIWMALEDILPYMSKEIKYHWSNYTCSTSQFYKQESRFEFCQKTVEQSYQLPPSLIMYVRKLLPKEKREKVQAMLKGVRAQLISTGQNVVGLNRISRKTFLEKNGNAQEVIGLPGNYFNDAVFEQINNGDPQDNNNSFFQTLLYQNKIKTDSLFFHLHMNASESKLEQSYEWATSSKIKYNENLLVIPVGVLQGDFYNPGMPMYLSYGVLGSYIGNELSKGMYEMLDNYGGVREKLEEIKLRKCINEQAQETKVTNFISLADQLDHFTGTNASYAAYTSWTNENGEEPRLPEMNLTPNQLFWIATAYQQCHNKTDLFKISTSLRNNPDFGKDFQCALGTKMNPKEKCLLF